MIKLDGQAEHPTHGRDDKQLDGRCEISVHSELPHHVDHAEYFKYDEYTRQHHTHQDDELNLPLQVVT